MIDTHSHSSGKSSRGIKNVNLLNADSAVPGPIIPAVQIHQNSRSPVMMKENINHCPTPAKLLGSNAHSLRSRMGTLNFNIGEVLA